MFREESCPRSVDSILIDRDGHVTFVEFKPVLNKIGDPERAREYREIMLGLMLKAAETAHIFSRYLQDEAPFRDRKTRLMIVTDDPRIKSATKLDRRRMRRTGLGSLTRFEERGPDGLPLYYDSVTAVHADDFVGYAKEHFDEGRADMEVEGMCQGSMDPGS